MFFRLLVYVFTGWFAMAAVAGLAPVLQLSVMLPATSSILLVHLAFSRWSHLHWGLALAVALGYLEDLHQGAPMGVLSTAHAVGWLLLYRASKRFTLVGPLSRVAAATIFTALVDMLTWLLLILLAPALGFGRGALNAAWAQELWHLVATACFVPALWLIADKCINLLDDLLLRDVVTVDGGRRSKP